MHAYQVGKLYHPGRRQWPETVQYNYRAGGHELVFFLADPSAKEIEALSQGKAEFALYAQDDQILLLYRFWDRQGNIVFDWSDAPYSWHRVPQGERTLPTLDRGHALLMIVVVNAQTGVIEGLRALTLSELFTTALEMAIINQSRQPYDPNEYERRLDDLYRRYPTSALMVRDTIARTEGGA